MTKINLKKYSSLTLTASKFMSTFYNFKEKRLNKLSHNDLKEIFPGLMQVQSEIITEESLAKGEIILVCDCKNEVRGYKNPYVYFENHEKNCQGNDKVSFEFTSSNDDFKKYSFENLDDLSIYELENLLRIAKRHQKKKEERLVKRELYFDKDNHSTKKVKQEKVRVKEIRKEDL